MDVKYIAMKYVYAEHIVNAVCMTVCRCVYIDYSALLRIEMANKLIINYNIMKALTHHSLADKSYMSETTKIVNQYILECLSIQLCNVSIFHYAFPQLFRIANNSNSTTIRVMIALITIIIMTISITLEINDNGSHFDNTNGCANTTTSVKFGVFVF